LRELYGKWEESFQLLFNWRAEVLKRCPGNVIEIGIKEVDGKFYFHRFFYALKPCIEGFLEGCRPYLSIDSTVLNGRWNGHLATACGIDGHKWMYLVAFGFIDGETIDNWTWFMTQLHKAIGDLSVLSISSDACKGLENAVKNVFPQVEHRECFRHLMNNFIKRFGGDVFSKMYPAARAYRESVFNYFYKSVTDASPQVLVWMEAHHYKLWMRSGFNPEIKCDYITNNLVGV
jgi:transposase-like protein